MKKPSKKCKLCGGKRYANLNLCYFCYRKREKEKKETKIKNKKERHEKTQAFAKEQVEKLIRINDRLFQEIGRMINKKCFCGRPYVCLHHFIRKSTCLATRWDLDNGIPVCNECHCRIHNGQDVLSEANYIRRHNLFENLNAKRQKIITNKLLFCFAENKRLKELKQFYEVKE